MKMYFALIEKEIDTETITKEEIKTAVKEYRKNHFTINYYLQFNLCEVIENSNIREKEKLEIYSYISKQLKNIRLLSSSLFNILLLLRENVNELPYDFKLASLKSLLDRYFIFTYNKKFTVKVSENMSIELEKSFYKITALGREYLSSMEERAKQYIEKQKNIFKELGV